LFQHRSRSRKVIPGDLLTGDLGPQERFSQEKFSQEISHRRSEVPGESSQELQGPGRVLLEESLQGNLSQELRGPGRLRCECTDYNLGVQRDNQLPY